MLINRYEIELFWHIAYNGDELSPSEYTTVSIPKILYEKVNKRIKGTGFTSVSRFVVFILRELVMEPKEGDLPFSEEDKKQLLDKLEKLGYT